MTGVQTCALPIYRGLDGAADNVHADLLILIGDLLAHAIEHLRGRSDHGDAAAGEDAFFDGRAAGVQRDRKSVV